MEIATSCGVMHVHVPKHTCDKCANCDWGRISNTGYPICAATGNSVMAERDYDGACGRDGRNFIHKGYGHED